MAQQKKAEGGWEPWRSSADCRCMLVMQTDTYISTCAISWCMMGGVAQKDAVYMPWQGAAAKFHAVPTLVRTYQW